jgi:hypothetical protein
VQNRPNWCIKCTSLCMKSCCHFLQRIHPIHPIGPQTHVLGHFGPFRYCINIGAKWTELVPLMHKFVQRSRVGIFHDEWTRSILLDAKLMCWGLSDSFLIARTLRRNGAINAEVRATKSLQNFSQRAHPIHPIGSQTDVLGHFEPFHYCTNFGAKQAELAQ